LEIKSSLESGWGVLYDFAGAACWIGGKADGALMAPDCSVGRVYIKRAASASDPPERLTGDSVSATMNVDAEYHYHHSTCNAVDLLDIGF